MHGFFGNPMYVLGFPGYPMQDPQSDSANRKLKQVIFGNRWRHILGERDFWEHVGGIDVYLAPSSFGQANTRAFDALLQKLHKYVPLGASVTDLYAGAGVIGLSLASIRKCRKDLSVRCVENLTRNEAVK
ncbi:putative methyltransferase [Tanacetum coccineum]